MNIKAENINEAIALLNQNRVAPSPIAAPPPPSIQKITTDSKEKNAGISLLVFMIYQSLSGNLKQRDILIRRVIQSHGELYIDGIAMDKRVPRLIKASSIREIRDISSGRIYTNPYDFIQNRLSVAVDQNKLSPQAQAQPNDFVRVIERTGAEMTALMYLVAIDGHRDKVEREKVFQYVKSRTTDLTYDDSELSDYLISLAPDQECFATALTKVLSQTQEIIQKFIEAVLDVITADGQIDKREKDFLVRIMDFLEEEGYNIVVPI
ncbi:MAG: TerB family tellurite resistance protein [Alphaproteobacteria bacterium]|nr:TerB family tellurite resistance protein [Alphaproteobacteria bacterium]